MMRYFRWNWTFAAVVLFFCMGVIGHFRTHVYQPPVLTFKQLAETASKTLISGLIGSEIAGADDKQVHTVLMQKNASGADQIVRQPNGQTIASLKPGTQTQAHAAAESAGKPAAAAKTGAKAAIISSLTERKIAFIYHSHNRESWLPELKGTKKDKPSEAFDAKINVTLLGARLQKQLEKNGVGAVHSGKDYASAVPKFNYNYSYKYSQKTVREALAVHSELQYLFDIHRDSRERNHSTVRINGKDYAQLYFIIGQGNPHWKENAAFAKQIHEELNKLLPGVSKGMLNKGSRHGHGEYNQSLSSASVLIEVGGVGNTLEESNRTIDTLAKVIAGIVRKAEKADAPAPVNAANAAADPS